MPKESLKKPFFVLEFCFEGGELKLVPYPMLDNKKRGPRLNLKSIWPAINDGLLPGEVPITFLYSTIGHLGNLEFTMDDIFNLRDEADAKIMGLYSEQEFRLNAYMLLGTTYDKRLQIPDSATGKLAEIKQDRHRITPVQFFAIEVEVPKQLSRDAKILQSAGLL